MAAVLREPVALERAAMDLAAGGDHPLDVDLLPLAVDQAVADLAGTSAHDSVQCLDWNRQTGGWDRVRDWGAGFGCHNRGRGVGGLSWRVLDDDDVGGHFSDLVRLLMAGIPGLCLVIWLQNRNILCGV